MSDQTTILAVDDSREALAMLSATLTGEGYRVRAADSGELALASAGAHPPDLILLDVRMEGLDGLEVCRRLKADERTRSIPVILISAFAQADEWIAGLQMGAADYVNKPFRTEELLTRVKAQLAIRQAELSLSHQAESLRESEERYRMLFNHSPDGIVIATPDWHYTDVNTSVCQMLGYTREELIGKHASEVVVPEDAPRITGGLYDEARTQARHQSEWTFRRKDGSTFVAEVIAATMPDGHPMAVMRDVTERKRAEEELRRSAERLELAQDAGGVGVWDWDVVSGQIEWTAKMFGLFGLDATKDTASFESWRRVLHPEDLARAEARIMRALDEHTVLENEYRVVMPNGEVRWINATGKGIYSDSGDSLRMIGTCTDITERKQAEEKLQEREEKYRLLFENVMNGFALHEIVLNDEGRPIDYIFLEVNHAFEQLTGLRRENIIGRKVTEVLPGIETDPADWIGKYGEVTLTGKAIRCEQYAQPLDRWYSVLAFRVREGQFAVIFEDVTERKRAEEKQRAALAEVMRLREALDEVWDLSTRLARSLGSYASSRGVR
jgi:PAS domain S-box-containing protein